ncbi:MAG TPA: TetR/AcrR family transcriptional regulator [Pseudonocardia sp.]
MVGRPRNDRARRDILRAAADQASEHGLEGLTIGGLATALGLSKSGLFGYFGSKQELQLATIRRATEVFIGEVITPAFGEPEGLARLTALCTRWLSYSRRRVFPGGCFFFAAMAEFDARPGPVRDTLAESSRRWNQLITSCIEAAMALGELAAETDPDQLAFELVAFMETANAMSLLHGGPMPYEHAQRAIQSRLGVSPLPQHD